MNRVTHHPDGDNNNNDNSGGAIDWWRGISLGNVLTMAGMAFGGVSALLVFMSAVARSDEQTKANTEEIKAVETRVNKRIDALTPRVDAMAQQVAVTNANLQLLLRAQGIKPITLEAAETTP